MYRVILTKKIDGIVVYHKTFHKSMSRETAFINFHKIKDKNKVLFPQRFVNTKGIKPVKYSICVSKITEEKDTQRILRDDYGRLYTEPFLGDWTILDSDDYQMEERFWIYGLDSKLGRPNIREVIKRLISNAYTKKMVKQVIVVHNKLIIYNEDNFDMVLCKNLEDAQRLHHTLAMVAKKQKIKTIMFMGTASKAMVGRMYDLVREKTKWSNKKIYRKTTRP